MSLDQSSPDFSAGEVVLADQIADQATDPHGHGPSPHTHCQNCGTELRGPFCHQCGQHDFDFEQSFGHLFLDALENFFHFDEKFFRNTITLLFRPGRLSAEFNAGKRASQVPPFRLYIFVSFLFFFISFLGVGEREANQEIADELTAEALAPSRETANTLEEMARHTTDPAKKAELEQTVEKLRRLERELGPKPKPEEKASPAVADQAAPTPAPAWITVAKGSSPGLHVKVYENQDNAFNRFMTEKGKYALRHQRELEEGFLHAVPKMLLFCLPFFALYTRVLFRRPGETYLHHLVMALHFHTFIYLWRLVATGWVFLFNFASPAVAGWLSGAAWLWLLLYPLLMLRALYGESWKRTLVKSGLLGLGYSLTLLTGFVATIIAVFVLL
ncbi:MAG: DUF3667 domain-containing protein [Opitutales bacterium]